jgi:hypothetical protein
VAEAPASPHVLGGISLCIAEAPRYLQALRRVLTTHYQDLVAIADDIDLVIAPDGLEPPVATPLGYVDPVAIVPLCEREWLDSPDNEFLELEAYLDRQKLLREFSTVRICGAGPCRLGDYVASLGRASRVVCTDLSWLMLYAGKLLLNNRGSELPSSFRQDRTLIRVDDDHRRFVETHISSQFLLPKNRRPAILDLRVENAFALRDLTEEVVCAPYLLDAFSLTRALTLLTNLCLALDPAQSLFAIVTLSTAAARPHGRCLSDIHGTMLALGFEIEFLDVTRLPYSFSRQDRDYRRETWSTLIIQAKKVESSDLERVAVISDKLSSLQVELSGHVAERPPELLALTEEQLAICRIARASENVRDLLTRLAETFDAREDDLMDAVRALACLDLIELRVAD